MLRSAFLVLGSLLVCLCVVRAQPLEAYWATSAADGSGMAEAIQKVDEFVADQQGAPGARHLGRVFRKFQHAFLRRYEAYADFPELFKKGTYDCLTATTLLQHILDKLGYRSEIVETTYHIFIRVQTPDGQILLETTDPIGGFVRDERAMAYREAEFQRNVSESVEERSSGVTYRYQHSVNRTIASADLIGLLLYNQAVKAYNTRNWVVSAGYLAASFGQYPTERCQELAAILLQTLHQHPEISSDERRTCLDQLGLVMIRHRGTVAATELQPLSFR